MDLDPPHTTRPRPRSALRSSAWRMAPEFSDAVKRRAVGISGIRKKAVVREFFGAVKRGVSNLFAGLARACQGLALVLETVVAVITFVIVTLVWT
jgi:hypothetical protein